MRITGSVPLDIGDFKSVMDECVKATEVNSLESRFVKVSKKDVKYKVEIKWICLTCLQILALLFIFAALLAVLILIGTIVFKQTMDNDDTMKELLTIIPTIFGNVLIYFTRKKIFDTKDLKIAELKA